MSNSSDSDRPIIDDVADMRMALWIGVGVLLLFVARRTYGALLSGEIAGAILTTQLFLTGIGIVFMAVSDRVDMARWGRPVAYWVAYTLLALSIYFFLLMPEGFYASDVSLFESYSSHLIAQGQNPMGANMQRALVEWEVSDQSSNLTATLGGGRVQSYAYPGGTLWLGTLEQVALPGNRLGLGNLIVCIAFLVWLIRRVGDNMLPLVTLAWLAPVVRGVSAARGMITPLWLFPLAVGLAAWYDDRLDLAAGALGIAIASKQLAWPIAGLVLVHVLRTQTRDESLRFMAVSGGIATVLVAPFVVWDPVAWGKIVFQPFLPFGSSHVAQGVGLTSLTVGGILTVPRVLHTILVVSTTLALLGATWRWPARMQWIVPFGMIAVMIVHYRTLPSYYAATIPLALVALDARLRQRGSRAESVDVPTRDHGKRLASTGGMD